MTSLEYNLEMLVSYAQRVRDAFEYREHLAATKGTSTWLDVNLASAKHAIDRAKTAVDTMSNEADRNAREVAA